MGMQSSNLAATTHSKCLLCGTENPIGLKLKFEPSTSGGVYTQIEVPARFQGYRGIAHGGIVAALLDAAMVHCLLKDDIPAVTCDLQVRYRHPVPINRTLDLRARIRKQRRRIYDLEGVLSMDGEEAVTASARFMSPQ